MKLNIIIEVVLILFNFILKVINLNKDIFLICFTYIFIKIKIHTSAKSIQILAILHKIYADYLFLDQNYKPNF